MVVDERETEVAPLPGSLNLASPDGGEKQARIISARQSNSPADRFAVLCHVSFIKRFPAQDGQPHFHVSLGISN